LDWTSGGKPLFLTCSILRRLKPLRKFFPSSRPLG